MRNWMTGNTDALWKKEHSWLYFFRRLASFNICNKLLLMFYQSSAAVPTSKLWSVGKISWTRGMSQELANWWGKRALLLAQSWTVLHRWQSDECWAGCCQSLTIHCIHCTALSTDREAVSLEDCIYYPAPLTDSGSCFCFTPYTIPRWKTRHF